jgi:2-aminoadipate transaminase
VPKLSERVRDLRNSPIRALLERTQNPAITSFAGGLPAADSFEDLALPPPPVAMLQYGPTEGEPMLRAKLSQELETIGLSCPAERILILSGSQQGIDLTAKLFADAGTSVAIESPAYLAALQVFGPLRPPNPPWPTSPRPSRTRPATAGPRKSGTPWRRPATRTM